MRQHQGLGAAKPKPQCCDEPRRGHLQCKVPPVSEPPGSNSEVLITAELLNRSPEADNPERGRGGVEVGLCSWEAASGPEADLPGTPLCPVVTPEA